MVSGGCLEGVWSVSCRCLEGESVWKVSGEWVSGGCPKCVSKVSRRSL